VRTREQENQLRRRQLLLPRRIIGDSLAYKRTNPPRRDVGFTQVEEENKRTREQVQKKNKTQQLPLVNAKKHERLDIIHSHSLTHSLTQTSDLREQENPLVQNKNKKRRYNDNPVRTQGSKSRLNQPLSLLHENKHTHRVVQENPSSDEEIKKRIHNFPRGNSTRNEKRETRISFTPTQSRVQENQVPDEQSEEE
jgi:hypothetical protein